VAGYVDWAREPTPVHRIAHERRRCRSTRCRRARRSAQQALYMHARSNSKWRQVSPFRGGKPGRSATTRRREAHLQDFAYDREACRRWVRARIERSVKRVPHSRYNRVVGIHRQLPQQSQALRQRNAHRSTQGLLLICVARARIAAAQGRRQPTCAQ
jgi:hypothetical protein